MSAINVVTVSRPKGNPPTEFRGVTRCEVLHSGALYIAFAGEVEVIANGFWSSYTSKVETE